MRPFLIVFCAGVALAAAACRDGAKATDHSGGEKKWKHYWARVEDPARDREPTTRDVMAAVDAKPGMRVADVGAGGGYFTFKVAPLVGASGRVVATDMDADMIAHLKREAAKRAMPQVEARLIDPSDHQLEHGAYDVILAVNVYLFWKEVPELSRAVLVQFRRALKKGGRIVIQQDNVYTGKSRKKEQCFSGACQSLTGEETAALARSLGYQVARLSPVTKELGEGHGPGYLLVLTTGP